ncbi:uncharacterized protein K489DRAFT_385197 [Dissoconium aciculare CBS 342.82]|jgi:hypothetical protein|uniref:C2H2-type domain-containing protein n=1 Tax=Dissoconium aciculare CBS 342.82 TaxID=1314786 RepID=A0A6J3LQA2_9PEZI|nr:uncharacterized protein K489DRAFT_385197 [Dissoconium aciculare CBS 342.82]KAF1818081.1 hypothetical protein K489DRAFT_385197 [Dissoconium aciculare CBS 342.82]
MMFEESDRQMTGPSRAPSWSSTNSFLMPTISEATGHEAIAEMPREHGPPATTIGIADDFTSSFTMQSTTTPNNEPHSLQASSDAFYRKNDNEGCLACGYHYTSVDDLANHQRAQHGLAEVIL